MNETDHKENVTTSTEVFECREKQQQPHGWHQGSDYVWHVFYFQKQKWQTKNKQITISYMIIWQ